MRAIPRARRPRGSTESRTESRRSRHRPTLAEEADPPDVGSGGDGSLLSRADRHDLRVPVVLLQGSLVGTVSHQIADEKSPHSESCSASSAKLILQVHTHTHAHAHAHTRALFLTRNNFFPITQVFYAGIAFKNRLLELAST